MTEERVIAKIEKFAKTMLRDVIILDNDDGSYELYDAYYVVPNKNGSYTVNVPFKCTTKVFSVLKNAVAWCTFDKRRLYTASNRIEVLDLLLNSCDVSIKIHSRFIKNSNDDAIRTIHTAKLNEEKLKRYYMKQEMESYLVESKVWQEKQFNKVR